MSDYWQGDALCAAPEHREMFLLMAERTNRTALAKARAVCAECPVFVQCGDYARANHVTAGYWAGRHRGWRDAADEDG